MAQPGLPSKTWRADKKPTGTLLINVVLFSENDKYTRLKTRKIIIQPNVFDLQYCHHNNFLKTFFNNMGTLYLIFLRLIGHFFSQELRFRCMFSL